jgi:hypothetical protein
MLVKVLMFFIIESPRWLKAADILWGESCDVPESVAYW